jgi:hypothetical protein
MQGKALLLLWNDIAPSVEPEYNRWHSREHVPERVSVPGILAGRRYVRAGGGNESRDPKYLSIYELESTAVLSSPRYLSLMDYPSPWSKTMRPHFSNIRRIACHRLASNARGIGGCIRVIPIPISISISIERTVESPEDLLDRCMNVEGMIAAHWCITDPTVPALAWNASGGNVPASTGILLLEATDPGSLDRARAEQEDILRSVKAGDGDPVFMLHHLVEQQEDSR